MANALKAVVLVAAFYGAAFASNVPLVFRLAYAATAIIVICFLWSRRSLNALDVRRQPLELHTQVGKTLREAFHLENKSFLPNFYIEIFDRSSLPGHQASRACPLMPKGRNSWEITTVCRVRGKFILGPYSIITADPFGVFRWRRFIPKTWTVVVYPPTYDLPHFRLSRGELIGGQSLCRRTHFATPNVAGIREYAPGDSLNRIHWPSTAKVRRLMTKEFELDPTSDIWIALDVQRQVQVGRDEESTTEYGVAIAASLAKHFLEQNRSVGVVAFGAHRTVIHSDRGARQLLKILEELAVMRAEGEWPLVEVITAEGTRFGRNTTLIAISPSLQDSWVTALELASHRGVKPIAVHLEASTFGEASSSLMLIGSFAAGNIPAIVVKKGDNIGETLCLSN